jgi:hypothetical protein
MPNDAQPQAGNWCSHVASAALKAVSSLARMPNALSEPQQFV